MSVYFCTGRLTVRGAEPKDKEDIYALMNDSEVLRFNCFAPPSPEQIAEQIEKGSYKYCVAEKTDDRVIGFIGAEESLRYRVESLCVSYMLRSEKTGKGYMSEALNAFLEYCFGTLGLKVVEARVFNDNARSVRMMERLGFTHEGTMRRAVLGWDGWIHDDRLYSLLREEFEVRPR